MVVNEWPRRRGTEVQRTRCREGEAGHHAQQEAKTGDTQRSPTVSNRLLQIAEQAACDPELVFTSLVHHIDVDFLREAYRRTRKDSAPGLDGVTAKQYAEHLEENLEALHERLCRGSYQAPPVKRIWLEKENGKQRPIGIPEFEDKIVQRAVSMLLAAVYEQDFYAFSYGFREGRSPHQALHELREQCTRANISCIVDADVSGFFDNIDRSWLRKIIQQRVNDGGILRLIGKWFNAGVVDGQSLSYPEKGTPQGGVISPLLGNIFLHRVLDEWFEQEVKPRLKGGGFLIRFADDFVMGFERQEDAQRVMAVLGKRFARFGLTIHPEKTTLVEFRKPTSQEDARGKGTFEFLGFTHYWARSRRGYWVIKRKTAGKRLRRAMKAIWKWCRYNRHTPLKEQYRTLCMKLRGHYQYYGLRGNYKPLEVVYKHTKEAWKYWLSRRSRASHITWEQFERIQAKWSLPKPRIIHNI